MEEKAGIDRFEEDWAVLLVAENERRVNLPRKDLPSRVKEGQWLQVEFGHGRLVGAVIDEVETATPKERIRAKLQRLKKAEHLR